MQQFVQQAQQSQQPEPQIAQTRNRRSNSNAYVNNAANNSNTGGNSSVVGNSTPTVDIGRLALLVQKLDSERAALSYVDLLLFLLFICYIIVVAHYSRYDCLVN